MSLEKFFQAVEMSTVSPDRLIPWIKDAKERAKRLTEGLKLIELLCTSWRGQDDPGKYGPYVFFVRDYYLDSVDDKLPKIGWCDAFFARELMPDLAAAERGVVDPRDTGKNYPVPLDSLSKARRENCTECDHNAFVIGTHWQTCDSPCGDTWKLGLQRFCPHCGLFEHIATDFDNNRLSHRLKRTDK